jgi:NOL1/NOP2/fmu family ribosome biogenesis protein
VRGEGLFVAVLRKHSDGSAARVAAPKGLKTVKAPGDWLLGEYTYLADGDKLRAVPRAHLAEMLRLNSVLSVVNYGLHVATVKGKDFLPTASLARAVDVNTAAWHTVDVDLNTALSYLRGEAVVIDAPRGIVLLTYSARPLGFVKNLGNRANNLLPDNRRILKR